MAAVSNQIWYYIFGGVFLGFWLWFLFVPDSHPDPAFQQGAWFLWGLIGIAIAGGAFAGRATSGPVQAALWVVTGIATAFVIASAVYEQSAHIFATLLAGVGAFLIAGGVAAMYAPPPPPERMAAPAYSPPPPGAQWRSAPPPETSTQQQPGQQQSVTVVRGGSR